MESVLFREIKSMHMLLKWIFKIAAVLIAAFLLITAYAYFIEPRRLVISEAILKVPHWSKELNGFKIVAISDIHAGSNSITEERLQKIAEAANAQNPDVIVLLGDYVSQIRGMRGPLKMPIEVIAENLKGMRAKYGIYAVIGNHDHWYNEAKCREAFEKAGFKVLENEMASINLNRKTISLIGIEDFWKRYKVDIKDQLSDINPQENIIGITHNPDSFDQTPDALSLLIAGHTHGGQVNIPFYGPPILVAKSEYTRGHIEKDGKNLYVTSGIGTSGPPVRFGVPPEIAVITLEAKE